MVIKLKKLKRNKPTDLSTAYIGIGTNKGDRLKNISVALKLLSQNSYIKLLKVSKLLKNPPQEGIKSGYFLNGAIKVLTSLRPFELLTVCQRIEKKLGRLQTKEREKKKERKKKPRTIDLDILFYKDETINTKGLTIPHPLLHKRYFVLIPLFEIAKDVIHPIFKKSVQELYALTDTPALKTEPVQYKDLNTG